MIDLGESIVSATRYRVGKKFQHHFKPSDDCQRGVVTKPECMRRGMNDDGYDCSGLVIASICEVVGLSTKRWPQHYRHAVQMLELGIKDKPMPGDVMMYISNTQNEFPDVHTGIYVAAFAIIHASGKSETVEEGFINNDFEEVKVIPSSVLVDRLTS